MAQPFSKAFYASKEWLACRASYIAKVFGLCERCKQPGKILHHIKHLTPENISDPNITLSHDNLRFLCKDCHELEHSGSDVTRNDCTFNSMGELVRR